MKITEADDCRLLEWNGGEFHSLARVREQLAKALLVVGPDAPEAVELRRAARALALIADGVALPHLEDVAEGQVDAIEPETIAGRDFAALLAVSEAKVDCARAETRLRDAVAAARERRLSWDRIGLALGTSKQAARTRFGIR